MQFVACRYSATGEGMTVMLLITKGYGPADPETNAQAEFERIFGSYYARGAMLHRHSSHLQVVQESTGRMEFQGQTTTTMEVTRTIISR